MTLTASARVDSVVITNSVEESAQAGAALTAPMTKAAAMSRAGRRRGRLDPMELL
jgi:hypothetical protein